MGSRLVWLLIAVAAASPAAAGAVVPRPGLAEDVRFLAAEGLEGRMTGSDGAIRAGAYVAERLEQAGVATLPGLDGYFTPFEFTAGTRDVGSSIALTAAGEPQALTWTGEDRVRALSFSDSGTVEGEVVFAGYGLVVPDSQDLAYDSYAGLDVEDKIVVVLRYFPEDAGEEQRSTLARYSGLRYKATVARDRGARALVVATGPRSPNAGKTIGMSFDTALSGSGIVAASVGGDVAERIFDAVEGRTLEQVQESLDSGNPHVAGFGIPGLTLRLDVKVERERRTARNVIGYLPPNAPAERRLEGAVVLGAHFDHLGRGKLGNSLARKDEEDAVHLGADDNASGVAALLEIAARLAPRERRRGVVVAFWTGEEIGLLGSSEFVKSEPFPVERVVAYVNFDMVGRMKDHRLNLQGAASSPTWPALIERANVPVGLDVHTQEDPYLPTDSTPFYQAGIPTLSFFTGSHEDYHRPSDSVDKLNLEGLEEIVDFATLLVSKLTASEEAPAYVKVEPKTRGGGDRDSLRAYTGTIPDYTTEVDGLRLSGVVGGGPADLAGLREGDVIVEFGGRKIANIYDYTYALDSVKIDQPVRVAVVRDGERVEVTVTPTARP